MVPHADEITLMGVEGGTHGRALRSNLVARLEDLKKGVRVRGVNPTVPVTVIDADWMGADALTLTYEDSSGATDREVLYRANESDLELADDGRRWSLDADPALFKLVAEAKRISLAYLFDPYLATETSDIEVLPHQIEAVYADMLPLRPLRFLLIDAIRSEDPVLQRVRMEAVIDSTVGARTQELIDAQSLLSDVLAPERTAGIRDELERARARKLQPGFVRSFFLAALARLGGRAAEREAGRYQVVGVPAALRSWDSANRRGRLLRNYERICFEHDHVSVPGRPVADLLAPGHPLLDAAVGVTLERHGEVLQQGTVLIDPQDWTETPRLLVFLEHEIVDGTTLRDGRRQVVSRRLEYVEITETGDVASAGRDPHIDLRAPDADEQVLLAPLAEADWVIAGLETTALRHAGEHNAPRHLTEVQDRVRWRVGRTLEAVESRLTEEIRYWGAEALRLKDKELAGQSGARLNSALAGRRADEATERLQRRRAELVLQAKLSVRRPRVVGGALVVPAGLVVKLAGTEVPDHAHDTVRTEKLAVAAVLAVERELGRDPVEMAHNNEGYDVETRGDDGRLLFIEVKGRVAGADLFTITNRELNYGLNNAERHILALVRVEEDDTTTVRYLYDPFGGREPAPSAAEYDRRLSWDTYWNLAEAPR
ncbi:MAG: DUF3883 domain-containing protein [bacterium]|nr:DUF3883 domain-containing protein [bacterium]